MDSVLEKYWIWIICFLFLIIRVLIECDFNYEFRYRLKKVLLTICVLAALITAWNCKSNNKLGLLIVTLFYIVYLLAERCAKTGGYTSSLLLFMNCTYITLLSFLQLKGAIIGSICIIAISIIIYRHWTERKCDLAENIALCLETIIISMILLFRHSDSLYYILLYLSIEESILNVLNEGLNYAVKKHYSEENEE